MLGAGQPRSAETWPARGQGARVQTERRQILRSSSFCLKAKRSSRADVWTVGAALVSNTTVFAPGKAWARRMNELKPCEGTLRVTKPARRSWPSSRKRVLRGGGATRPAKRKYRLNETATDSNAGEAGAGHGADDPKPPHR